MTKIQDFTQKIKFFIQDDNLFTVILLFFVAVSAFGLGRQSISTSTPSEAIIAESEQKAAVFKSKPTFATPESVVSDSGSAVATNTPGQYVASKNSDKYHLPWCSGAARITDTNKVWFASKAEAETAGYKPASNCPGI